MTLWKAFQEGGWGMWFILIFGILALIASARYMWRGQRNLEAFGRWMTLTTLLSAIFAFCVGMTKVCVYVAQRAEPEQRGVIFIEGLGEALNCLDMGFLLVTLSCLLIAVGKRRFAEG